MAIANPYAGKERGGRRSVSYRDARGMTYDATVEGPGSVSGFKVRLTSHRSRGVIDNVPIATGVKGTGVIFSRKTP